MSGARQLQVAPASLREFAQRLAVVRVERRRERGLVYTRAQAEHLTREYEEQFYRQLVNHRRKKLRLQERCVGQMISDMISANQRLCEAFPGKLMQAFENEDFWAFEEEMDDEEVPEEVKKAAVCRICRMGLFRLHAGITLPYRLPGASINRMACFGLPFDVLSLVMAYLPPEDFHLYGSVCRDYLRACHTVLATTARRQEALLAEWFEPGDLIAACDCNMLPSLPPMATMAVPCAVLLARHAPNHLPELMGFVSNHLPGVQRGEDGDHLLEFLRQVTLRPTEQGVAEQLAEYLTAVMPEGTAEDTAAGKEARGAHPVVSCSSHAAVRRWEAAAAEYSAAEAQFTGAKAQWQRQRRIDAGWAISEKAATQSDGQRSKGRGGRGRRAAPDLSRYGPNVRVPALHATPEAVAVAWDPALGDRDPARSAATKAEEAEAWRRAERRFAVTRRRFEALTAECREAAARAGCQLPGCRCRVLLGLADSDAASAALPLAGEAGP
eukprot:EG_transcript_7759